MKKCGIFISLVLIFSVPGCGKREASVDATQPLKQSFQTAEPATQQAITTVTTSLKAGNYIGAARALEPVINGSPLNDPQRAAVNAALQQINQAIDANRSLDTKEMYELRAKMFNATHPPDKY
jgi:hypothetical protein